MNDDEARELFEIAYDALRPGGRFVTIDAVLRLINARSLSTLSVKIEDSMFVIHKNI